ncbi:rRNA-processing protein [Spiromyces aspiralis]|uniref:rRNA-processing protein n=1 Tax=Spiromyces aspiralis TaxID=68401 RepID=A0ACC1HIJ9_9FUNG|nr:rRNA-processing protein [Spiromyces aspiralis]
MISALCWVKRGAAKEYPQRYEMTEEEYKRINSIVSNELEDAKQNLKDAESKIAAADVAATTEEKEKKAIEEDPELAGLDMENYSDDDGGMDGEDEVSHSGADIFSNIRGLAYYDSNKEDPYITIPDEEDSSEKEETRILPTDNLLVAAKTEDDISQIEVLAFEGEHDHMYNHQDMMLPEFPLCLEWLDFPFQSEGDSNGNAIGDKKGNLVAVGTFSPNIEIWDLDVLDSMYPRAVLGNPGKKNRHKRKGKPHSDYHTDAVMGLSWNRLARNILASSSADTTVKLWDLTSTKKCVRSFNHHKDKVQAVQWHPREQPIILTGGYDRTVAVFDTRVPEKVTRWSVAADVESVAWDPHSPSNFYVAMENGIVQYYDARNTNGEKGGEPLFTLHAHDQGVPAFDIHPALPGCIVTGSLDKTIKVWSTKDNRPSMVTSRTLDVGRVFAARFSPDAPYHLAVAGSRGNINIWDLSTNAAIRALSRQQGAQIPEDDIQEKPLIGHTVTLGDKDSDDDDDDDNGGEGEERAKDGNSMEIESESEDGDSDN